MPSCIRTDIPLAPHTTLGVGGPAQFFAEVDCVAVLEEVVIWAKREGHPITLLGCGSNVLISENGIRGLVIRYVASEIAYEERADVVRVTADAGVILDALIHELVLKDLWGLENLSAIPGHVGAVPVQNVGAYGVEAKEIIESVFVYDTSCGQTRTLTNTECAFGYRDSLFKKAEGSKYIILSVTFTVVHMRAPRLTYKDLTEYFGTQTQPSLHEIREAIITIRGKKLPDWHEIGTAGSFFKNPIVPLAVYEALVQRYPELPGFPQQDGDVKVSLGWILDRVCGLKGYREGKVGLYEKQALVLVCEHGATAREVTDFVARIIALVYEKTSIVIEPEVRML
ncbi:UDP-N-acetylmuramate dehydrogenase [Candidatus Kaiserbacteria bacterium]|nr:MAG: UDP-N-acetylmuramate dehydrogenase [Candidatus Kaiserbacteria bacterium]